ncbi:response regulator transcription factor [Variovorax sp. PCZ-1]|uniref:response regulator n=1 Tax=Variovorax sp. PCZ-1 TaxID=2835533 RepID=UPI001BD0601E|nr:response regulator transcription factor [Variovorax sp. PCZ-1]MBS7807939.1 response regulator transcription factor [Variovorax sp. PCZ-1]
MQTALILEDLPEIRAWLAQLLQSAFPSIQITATSHVKEALAAVSQARFDLALIDLGLPDGSGVEVVKQLRDQQPQAVSVVVTIHDDDQHLFPALQAGAFGYLLKEQEHDVLVSQLLRIMQGEPPLSPSIARRVLAHFSQQRAQNAPIHSEPEISLTERETDVLMRLSKGYTLQEIAAQIGISRHTVADHVKAVYRKLGISSRAEATLVAIRRGLVV